VKIVDLTIPLSTGMSVYPGDPPLELARARSHDLDGYEVTRICLGSHTGTHVDAPRHFFAGGSTLDSFPLERLVGPGVVFDCRNWAIDGAADRLTQQLRRCPLQQGGLALLWTEGALLTVGAAKVLLDAGAGLVGIDAPSVDAEPHPVHRLLMERNVLIAENLRGLEHLGPGPVTCAFLPLALTGTDGAPMRAVAWR
jgi:arylformamidase